MHEICNGFTGGNNDPSNLKISPSGLEMQCLSKQQLASKPKTVSLAKSQATTGLSYWDSLGCVKGGKIILVCVPVLQTVSSRSLPGNTPNYL